MFVGKTPEVYTKKPQRLAKSPIFRYNIMVKPLQKNVGTTHLSEDSNE